MRISSCRICKKKNLKKLFSLGNLCFTGKFPSANQKIKKKPITLVLCKNCGLVQLGHNFDLIKKIIFFGQPLLYWKISIS